MLENIKWDKIGYKVKSFVYISIVTEATNIFRQRNVHMELGKSPRDALVIQIKETFKEIRNETFDRFQLFRCTQNPGEWLEQSTHVENKKAAMCNWENLEDSLVTIIFIQGLAKPQIQMDLLSHAWKPKRDEMDKKVNSLI